MPGESPSLARLAVAAAARWEKAAGAKGLRIVRQSEGPDSTVISARSDLDRALDALVENAVVYSPAGGGIVIADRPGLVEVLDEGPGLATGEQDAILERFYRGRAGRQGVAGTGLGLPIASELASQWGGRVALENRVGGGARASLILPVEPVPSGQEQGDGRLRT